MSVNDTWNKVSAVLSELLTASLKKQEATNLMSAWTSKKNEISKLLVKKEAKVRVAKKKKDENAPKKWKSSYIIFCGKNRDAIKDQNPTLTNMQLTSKLGEAWKALSEKEKAKYQSLALEDKQRYETEMSSYVPPETDETEEKVSKKKRKEGGVKRKLTNYIVFCQKERPNVVGSSKDKLKNSEVVQELASRWRVLTDEQKSSYKPSENVTEPVKDSVKDSVKEQVKVKDSVKDSVKEQVKDSVKEQSKPGKDSKKKETKEPSEAKGSKNQKKGSRPPVNRTVAPPVTKQPSVGFKVFTEEVQDTIEEEHPDWNPKKVSLEIEKKWKALSKGERAEYESLQDENDDEPELEDE